MMDFILKSSYNLYITYKGDIIMSLKLSARCIKVNGELINFAKTAELQIHGDTALECLEIIDGGDEGFTVIRSGAITDCPNLTTVICSKSLTHIDYGSITTLIAVHV